MHIHDEINDVCSVDKLSTNRNQSALLGTFRHSCYTSNDINTCARVNHAHTNYGLMSFLTRQIMAFLTQLFATCQKKNKRTQCNGWLSVREMVLGKQHSLMRIDDSDIKLTVENADVIFPRNTVYP